jgi:cytochrome c peroxidase
MVLMLYRVAFFWVALCVSLGCNQERKPSSRKKKEVETIDVLGALPLQVTDPSDNPSTPEKVALGKLLFYDPILSGNRDVSCATCHQPEFGYAEFLPTSIGVNGVGSGTKRRFREPNTIPFVKRNSQSVVNTAFNGLRKGQTYHAEGAPMFWDLRASGLEEQALIPIQTLEEMRGHDYSSEGVLDEVVARLRKIPAYRAYFEEAFPKEEHPVNKENLGRALASFQRSLISNNTRFDHYMRGDSGALSLSEKEGLNLFLSSGCAKCHHGPMFSDFQLHALGVPESDHLTEPDQGANADFTFRTPTLRNLRFTAPYMHSGKFATLKQVLEFYEDIAGSKIRNPNVSSAQIDPLVKEMSVNFKDIPRIVEFLLVLSDESFDRTRPESVPSGLTPGGN